MTDVYLYCFSNECMPGIFKIGMTTRTPEIRLKEANSYDTWRPPTPYKIDFAKKVYNVKQKEITLHKILTQYTVRINPNREFFRVSLDEIMKFFELIDGDLCVKNKKEDYEKNEDDEENDNDKNTNIKKDKTFCSDMSKCFTNGQKICHTIGINKTWTGKYDSLKNEIICNEKTYNGKSPLNQFVKSHYETERNDRTSSTNAWKECECEIKNGYQHIIFNIKMMYNLKI